MNNDSRVNYNAYSSIPIRRLLARCVDSIMWVWVLANTFVFVFPLFPIKRSPSSFYIAFTIYIYIIFLLFMFIDAWLISKFKKSFGKAMFGISVTDNDSNSLSFKNSWLRNRLIIKDGLGFFIPVYSLIKLYKVFALLKKDTYGKGRSSWDKDTNSVILHEHISLIPYIVAIYMIGKFIFVIRILPESIASHLV